MIHIRDVQVVSHRPSSLSSGLSESSLSCSCRWEIPIKLSVSNLLLSVTMMANRCTLLPEVLPNHVSCRPELDPEPTCGFSDELPLPGKTMEECSVSTSEQPRYYTQMSTKLDGELMSPALDAYTKQW